MRQFFAKPKVDFGTLAPAEAPMGLCGSSLESEYNFSKSAYVGSLLNQKYLVLNQLQSERGCTQLADSCVHHVLSGGIFIFSSLKKYKRGSELVNFEFEESSSTSVV